MRSAASPKGAIDFVSTIATARGVRDAAARVPSSASCRVDDRRFSAPYVSAEPTVRATKTLRGAAGRRWRIEWRRQLVPQLHFVAVGILGKQIGLTGYEFAVALDSASGRRHRHNRRLDVLGTPQPEAEVNDTARLAGVPRLVLEHDDIVSPRCL